AILASERTAAAAALCSRPLPLRSWEGAGPTSGRRAPSEGWRGTLAPAGPASRAVPPPMAAAGLTKKSHAHSDEEAEGWRAALQVGSELLVRSDGCRGGEWVAGVVTAADVSNVKVLAFGGVVKGLVLARNSPCLKQKPEVPSLDELPSSTMRSTRSGVVMSGGSSASSNPSHHRNLLANARSTSKASLALPATPWGRSWSPGGTTGEVAELDGTGYDRVMFEAAKSSGLIFDSPCARI
ncbi:unnamed protein product, partial [Prorocentrum cordatum]